VTVAIENTPAAWSRRAAAATPWESAGWSEHGQTARMESVLAALDPRPGESLLDYGCGPGRLSDFLPSTVGDYVGYDPAQGMIARAKREHPDDHVFQTWEPTGVFDLTVFVGTFNLADRWSKQMTWATLRRRWDATGRALAACLYAGEDGRCLTYTQAEAEKFARAESYYWRVERHLPNDLLLVLEK
jgi:SAM-dependent methyltransferase